MKKRGVVLVMGNEEVEEAMGRYLKYVMDFEDVYMARLGDPASLFFDRENIKKMNFWIIEVFSHKDLDNPEGFRTAEKLCDGKKSFLLLFHSFQIPDNFPEEGKFWITLPTGKKLSEKIEEAMDYIPVKEDFENLKKIWSLLGKEPYHHHHHISYSKRGNNEKNTYSG